MSISNVLRAVAVFAFAGVLVSIGLAIGAQNAAVGDPVPEPVGPDVECVAAIEDAEEAIAAGAEYRAVQEVRAAMAAGEGEGDLDRVDQEAAEVAERYRQAREQFERTADACRGHGQ